MNATEAPSSAAFLEVSCQLLASGYRVRFRADGSSMYPTIRDKETITVASTEASAIRKGDIVLYRLGRGVIAHRVVRVEREREDVLAFVLRGDAADSGDAPVGPQQILGKVLFVDRAGRRISLTGRWARCRQALRAGVSRLKRTVCRVQSGRTGTPPLGDCE